MSTTVTLEFTGILPQQSFAEFAAHRAARLSISCEILTQSDRCSVICLHGAAALLDAFEMALSLGPADCLVHGVRRTPAAAS